MSDLYEYDVLFCGCRENSVSQLCCFLASPAVEVIQTPHSLPFNLLPAALFVFEGSSKYCRQLQKAR